jgi:2-enoate reductase
MKLFEPGKIGSLSLKNRIVMAAMGASGLTTVDGSLTPRAIDYYVARAKGGTGLITTGSHHVAPDLDSEDSSFIARVDKLGHFSRLNELAEAIHDYRAKLVVQLATGFGRVAFPKHLGTKRPVAVSVLPYHFDRNVMSREITIEEIERLLKALESAAGMLKSAGVDGVEIHAHAGYLIDEFMTPIWNKRTDEYGGDIEGRMRFPREVIEAVKRGAGADFPVIYRYALTHYLEGGREIDEGLEIARRLEAAGADALHIDAGCYETPYWSFPPTFQPPGCEIDLAEMTKKVVKIPVIAVGKLGYPDLAERVLQEGKADFIALARPLLADPEWPNKVKQGNLEDIRPCIGDNECTMRVPAGKYVSCTVNPTTGMEREFAIKPAEKKKSVLVVGGGPGGMEAARIAALRQHKVILWEKGDELGGNLIPASAHVAKSDYRRLIEYLSTQIKKLGVNVELGKEATPELIQEAGPDAVIIATGSTVLIPDIPGVQKENVVTAVDSLLGKRAVGESVVVAGGGLIGCETALYLAEKGKKVSVVELLKRVMRRDAVPGSNRTYLEKLLREAGVKILTGVRVIEVTDDGVIIADNDGKQSTLKADTVVLAMGMSPNNGLFESLEDKIPEVYAIGDCVEPRRVLAAIWEGFRTARLI